MTKKTRSELDRLTTGLGATTGQSPQVHGRRHGHGPDGIRRQCALEQDGSRQSRRRGGTSASARTTATRPIHSIRRFYQGQFEIAMSHAHRNYLTEITPDNVVGPELAESWEASDDARIWVLNLRKGVEFHDGKSFTSEDVVDSLNHHRGEDTSRPPRPARNRRRHQGRRQASSDHYAELRFGGFPYVLTGLSHDRAAFRR